MYAQGCGLGGRAADPVDWRIAKSIFVADNDATAQRHALDPESAYGYYYWNLMTKQRRAAASLDLFKEDPALPDGDCTLEYVLDPLLAEEVMPRVNRALGDDRA